MKTNNVCIAVDFGGTKMLIGAVTDDGEILSTKSYNTGFRKQSDAAEAVLECLDNFILEKSWGNYSIAAVGIGLVGQIDSENGVWDLMYNDADDAPVALASMISQKHNVPCALDNDVKVALAAEHKYGSGADCNNLTYINVGTGIASASICDGRIVRGKDNNAGEIGHYVTDLSSDVLCFCGRLGCVEAISSGYGIFNRCKQIANAFPESKISEMVRQNKMDTVGLFELADMGDEHANNIIQDAVKSLVVMIGNVICSYSPEIIVLGGGLFCDDWIYNKILAALPDAISCSGVTIRITNLNPRTIGLKGAAIIGFSAASKT